MNLPEKNLSTSYTPLVKSMGDAPLLATMMKVEAIIDYLAEREEEYTPTIKEVQEQYEQEKGQDTDPKITVSHTPTPLFKAEELKYPPFISTGKYADLDRREYKTFYEVVFKFDTKEQAREALLKLTE